MLQFRSHHVSLVFHCLQGRFGSEPLDISSSFPPGVVMFSDGKNCGWNQALCAHPEASPSRTCDAAGQSAAGKLEWTAERLVTWGANGSSWRTSRQCQDGLGQPEILGGSALFFGAFVILCQFAVPTLAMGRRIKHRSLRSECWQEVAVTHTFCTERQWRGWEKCQKCLKSI